MPHYCIPLLLLFLAVIAYQPLREDGAVTYNYTQDKEVKELSEKAANDLAALVLKILEKAGKTELVRQTGQLEHICRCVLLHVWLKREL